MLSLEYSAATSLIVFASSAPALLSPPLASPAAVRRLALQVSTRLDGLLQGDHLGHLPGPGTEPAEARAYTPGDDVRRIDWAVTARTQAPHVRQSVAERELETTLLVDPETDLPVRIVVIAQKAGEPIGDTGKTASGVTLIFEDFDWNAPLADAIFSLDVPPGYTTVEKPSGQP